MDNVLTFKEYFLQESLKNKEKVIIDAIKNKKEIRFHYEDDEEIERGVRWVQPVAFGYSKAGKGLLRAFQLRGPTFSKYKPMWRLFRLDKISDIETSLRTFSKPKKGYNPDGDKKIANLVVNAKFKLIKESFNTNFTIFNIDTKIHSLTSLWMKPDGTIIEPDAKMHSDISYGLFDLHPDELCRNGWIRINVSPQDDVILIQGNPSSKQFKELKDLSIFQNMDVMNDVGKIIIRNTFLKESYGIGIIDNYGAVSFEKVDDVQNYRKMVHERLFGRKHKKFRYEDGIIYWTGEETPSKDDLYAVVNYLSKRNIEIKNPNRFNMSYV